MLPGLGKSFVLGLLLNATLALIGIIRSKYMAVEFGTAAVGLLSQAFQLQLIAITFGSLNLANAIISGLSGAESSMAEKNKWLSTSFVIQIVMSLSIVGLSLFFSGPFSEFVFGDRNFERLFVLTMLGVPFLVLGNHQLQAVFFVHKGFDHLNRVAIVLNVVNLLLFFFLAHHWRLEGAVTTVTTLACMQFLFYAMGVRRYLPLTQVFSWSWDLQKAKYLLSFAGTTLFTSVAIYGGNFLVRRHIIDELGLEANGWLQVPVSLSMYYVPIVSWVLWGRVYPILAKEKYAAVSVFNKLLFQSIWGFLVMSLIILWLREPIVLLLLTKDFLPALPLIPPYLLGDLFFLVCTIYGAYLLALGKLRAYVVGHFIFIAFYLTGVVMGLKHGGLSAVPYAFCLSGLLTFIFLVPYLVRQAPVLLNQKILVSLSLVFLSLLAFSIRGLF